MRRIINVKEEKKRGHVNKYRKIRGEGGNVDCGV